MMQQPKATRTTNNANCNIQSECPNRIVSNTGNPSLSKAIVAEIIVKAASAVKGEENEGK